MEKFDHKDSFVRLRKEESNRKDDYYGNKVAENALKSTKRAHSMSIPSLFCLRIPRPFCSENRGGRPPGNAAQGYGGEQQRAALCKLLLTKPKLLLLDEPTKGIDTYFKKKLAAILRRLMEEGMTVLLVSHDVEFCASYADHVAFFFDGQFLTQNTPRNFFSAHAYYTTTAHRMSRGIFQQAITKEDALTV